MNPKHFMAHCHAFKVEQKMKSPFISKLPSNNFPTLTVPVKDNINANHCPFTCCWVPWFLQLIIMIVIIRHWLTLGQQSQMGLSSLDTLREDKLWGCFYIILYAFGAQLGFDWCSHTIWASNWKSKYHFQSITYGMALGRTMIASKRIFFRTIWCKIKEGRGRIMTIFGRY